VLPNNDAHHYLPQEVDVRKSIVDTSTLLVFLGLSFLSGQETSGTSASQSSDVFRMIGKPRFREDTRQQELYLSLLGKIHEIQTTSHVIGELNGHISNFKNKQLREDLLHHTLDILTQKRLQEKLITVIDIATKGRYDDIVARIGIVDSGLLLLAQQTKLPLLTEDERTLGTEAERLLPSVRCLVLPWLFLTP
jgi:hypothetical protein